MCGKRYGDRSILLASAYQGLNKYRRCIAPYGEPVERTNLCLKCDNLFIFLAHRCSVIEADQHAEFVAFSPLPHKKEVGDLERETLRRCGDSPRLC
jgi:hypothetical protein